MLTMRCNEMHDVCCRRRGFSLLELVVGIAVLMSVIAAFLTLAQRSLVVAQGARDQLIAAYLAQDAVEYIRAKKDDNFILSSGKEDWLRGFANCYVPDKCTLDSTTDNPPGADKKGYAETCPSGACPPLSYSPSEKKYGYGAGGDWQETKFKREAQLEIVDHSGDLETEMRIIVKVKWPVGGVEKTFTLRSNIFNLGGYEYDPAN